jgi:hypothetical protein
MLDEAELSVKTYGRFALSTEQNCFMKSASELKTKG